MKKTKPLYADLMAKYIFGTEENLIYTAHLLELFFKLEPGTLANATIRNSVHLSRETINKKGFEMDIIVESSFLKVINIEFYTKYDLNSEIKSFMYIANKFSNSLKVGEEYSQAKKINQINFVKNNLVHHTEKMISEYLILNKDDIEDQMISEFFQLFIVDLDQEINQDYNNDELMRWIKLIGAETDEEMQEIVKGNAMMEEVYEKMKEFSQEEWVNDYFNKERLVKSQHNSELREQKEKLTEEFNEKERLVRSQHNSELREQKEKLTEEFNEKERLVRSQHNSELREQKEKMIENMILKNYKLEDIAEISNMPLNAIKDIKKKIEARK